MAVEAVLKVLVVLMSEMSDLEVSRNLGCEAERGGAGSVLYGTCERGVQPQS